MASSKGLPSLDYVFHLNISVWLKYPLMTSFVLLRSNTPSSYFYLASSPLRALHRSWGSLTPGCKQQQNNFKFWEQFGNKVNYYMQATSTPVARGENETRPSPSKRRAWWWRRRILHEVKNYRCWGEREVFAGNVSYLRSVAGKILPMHNREVIRN